MPWYLVRLSSAQISAGEEIRMQNQFQNFFVAADTPRDMAMLSAQDAGDHPVHLYFSPATAVHAEAFLRLTRANACERPPITAALAVGHADALARFRKGEL